MFHVHTTPHGSTPRMRMYLKPAQRGRLLCGRRGAPPGRPRGRHPPPLRQRCAQQRQRQPRQHAHHARARGRAATLQGFIVTAETTFDAYLFDQLPQIEARFARGSRSSSMRRLSVTDPLADKHTCASLETCASLDRVLSMYSTARHSSMRKTAYVAQESRACTVEHWQGTRRRCCLNSGANADGADSGEQHCAPLAPVQALLPPAAQHQYSTASCCEVSSTPAGFAEPCVT